MNDRYFTTRNGSQVSESDAVTVFMLSYHHAREDRMTRDEARNSALGFIRQTLAPNFPDDLVPEVMLP